MINLFVAFPIFQDMRHFWPESLDSSNRQNSSADPKRSKRSRLKPTSSWNGQSNILVKYENKSFTWWNCDNLVAIRVFIELSVLFNFKLDSVGGLGNSAAQELSFHYASQRKLRHFRDERELKVKILNKIKRIRAFTQPV